eukprot:TRINITY_DN7175_c1_g1_i1.p1 TRINITY_DN7175_c1_g1~~TRINITY_DN7175_c1_g1_i1.p1  ORF type:complete len:232 (-),score=46.49 TRINITY_DN7175_c1_g1_i1:287-982(-)
MARWVRLDLGSPIGFDICPEDYLVSFAELIVPRKGYKEKTKISGDYPAHHCEFYIDAVSEVTVGRDEKASYPIHVGTWFKFYVSVDEPSLVHTLGGTIACVGATAVYPASKQFRHPEGPVTKLFEGFPVENQPGYYKIDVAPCEHWKGHTGPYDVSHVRFFVEVERENGRLDRLWVDNRGAGFTIPDFWDPRYPVKTYTSSPWMSEVYLDQSEHLDAPIFHQKGHCKHHYL